MMRMPLIAPLRICPARSKKLDKQCIINLMSLINPMNLKSQIAQDQNQEQKTNSVLIKILGLGIVSVVPAYFFGYALNSLFSATSLVMLILAFAAGVIFLALFVIQNLLIQQFWLFAAIAAGGALVMLAGGFS